MEKYDQSMSSCRSPYLKWPRIEIIEHHCKTTVKLGTKMSLGYSSWGKSFRLAPKKRHLCDYLRIETTTAAITRITGTVSPE